MENNRPSTFWPFIVINRVYVVATLYPLRTWEELSCKSSTTLHVILYPLYTLPNSVQFTMADKRGHFMTQKWYKCFLLIYPLPLCRNHLDHRVGIYSVSQIIWHCFGQNDDTNSLSLWLIFVLLNILQVSSYRVLSAVLTFDWHCISLLFEAKYDIFISFPGHK